MLMVGFFYGVCLLFGNMYMYVKLVIFDFFVLRFDVFVRKIQGVILMSYNVDLIEF